MSATFLSTSLLRRYLNNGLPSYLDFNWAIAGTACVMGGNLAELSNDPVFDGNDPSLLGACDTNSGTNYNATHLLVLEFKFL